MRELWELFKTKTIGMLTDANEGAGILTIDYSNIYEYAFHPIITNVIYGIIFISTVTIILSSIIEKIFNIDLLTNYIKKNYLEIEVYGGLIILFFINMLCMSGIIYLIMILWPLWLLIGLLLAIKHIKWRNISNNIKNLFKKPVNELDLYKENLLK
jgi:hypothetical protein